MLNPNASFPLVAVERNSTMRRTPSTMALSSQANNVQDRTTPNGTVADAAPAAANGHHHPPAEDAAAQANGKSPPQQQAACEGAISQITPVSTNELSSAAVIVAMDDAAANGTTKHQGAAQPLANGNGTHPHA